MANRTIDVSLGDSSLFELAIGRRRTKKELLSLPNGGIPIISARLDIPFGYINTTSFVCNNGKSVLWNIDSSRWSTRVVDENYKFIPTDHCGYMKILDSGIVPEYIAYKLYECGLHLGFKHEYRASLTNIKEITIPIPIDEQDRFDINAQIELAKKYHLCKNVQEEIINIANDLSGKRIIIASKSRFARITIGDIMSFEKGKAKYTEKYCNDNQGHYPVYSAGTKTKTIIGYINTYDFEKECLKITTNGHYAGTVEYLAEDKFSLNGDAGILYLTNPKDKDIFDYRYIEYALKKAREEYGFNWLNKPTKSDILAVEITVPIRRNKWDIVEQRRIAERYKTYKDHLIALKNCTDGLSKRFIKVD